MPEIGKDKIKELEKCIGSLLNPRLKLGAIAAMIDRGDSGLKMDSGETWGFKVMLEQIMNEITEAQCGAEALIGK